MGRSGLQAAMQAAQAIRAGDAEFILAGGMESMSNAPHLVMGSRKGIKYGDGKLVDADDSAVTYLRQLQTTAPANAATQRAGQNFVSACLRKAREAALAKNAAAATLPW